MTLKEKANRWISIYTGIDIATIEAIKLQYHDNLRNAYLAGAKELKQENKQLEKQLEQAKKIIKEYMRFESMIGTCAFYSEEYEKTKKKAKQFLKE